MIKLLMQNHAVIKVALRFLHVVIVKIKAKIAYMGGINIPERIIGVPKSNQKQE